MTKWKTQGTETILTMHAHNRWSKWGMALLFAAKELDLIVATTVYSNHYDGSRSQEWYVPAGQLERLGGRMMLENRAYDIAYKRSDSPVANFDEW